MPVEAIRKVMVDRSQCRKILRLLDPLRTLAYTSHVGGRYFSMVETVPEIGRFVRDPIYEEMARDLLGQITLGYLSLSALDVLPGDPGIGVHVDWPHALGEREDAPHLSAQFVLSLDGTTGDRAPLWIGKPDNQMVLRPGEMLVFGGNTVHGVHPNRGQRSRTSLLWSLGPFYIRPMLRGLWDWWVPAPAKARLESSA